MKKYILLALLSLQGFFGAWAQEKNMVAIGLSYNQISISYGRDIDSLPFSIEGYIGVCNQDIDPFFNDLIIGVRSFFAVTELTNARLGVCPGVGFCMPDNKYYRANTIFYEFNIRYMHFLKNNSRHSLSFEFGYRYGEKEYLQQYSNEFLNVESLGVFSLEPLNISFSYGFKF